MSWRQSAGWELITCAVAACTSGEALAAPGQPLWANAWRTDVGFFDAGPTCLLDTPGSIDPSGLYLRFDWSVQDGTMLWLMERPDEISSVHLESEDSGDAWTVALEPRKPALVGRRAFLETDVAAGIMRSLELGHALTVVVSLDNGATLRHRVPASGAQIGVPMYRACMKSVTDDPPRYLFHPGRPFLGSYKAGESCEFEQIIELRHIPVLVTLSADADGGEIFFQRSLHSPGFEGPYQARKGPDHIEAQALFSQSFDLVEEYRYEISTDQLNELVADLLRGTTRKFGLTTEEGAKSTLKFGGSVGKPFAAMFAACRQARFSTKELGTQ